VCVCVCVPQLYTFVCGHCNMPLPKILRASFPAAKTLYDIIGCPSDAPAAALKRAYYKAALQHHPDKAGASPESTARFQALTIAHSVLSDVTKRREYDATGEVDLGEGGGGGGGEGSGGVSFATWEAHWRTQFPAFTEKDIDAFAGRYRNSKEEEEDVIAAYEDSKGCMDGVLERVPCSELDDEARFVAVVHAAIAAGRVKPLKAFTKLYGKEPEATGGGGGGGGATSSAAVAARGARAARAAQEAAEAEAHLAELRAEFTKKTGAAGEPSLADMLRQRQMERASAVDSFADHLAAKYGGGGGRKALEDAGGGGGKSPKRKRK
jgi:DnaJ family protein C protein 9